MSGFLISIGKIVLALGFAWILDYLAVMIVSAIRRSLNFRHRGYEGNVQASWKGPLQGFIDGVSIRGNIFGTVGSLVGSFFKTIWNIFKTLARGLFDKFILGEDYHPDVKDFLSDVGIVIPY